MYQRYYFATSVMRLIVWESLNFVAIGFWGCFTEGLCRIPEVLHRDVVKDSFENSETACPTTKPHIPEELCPLGSSNFNNRNINDPRSCRMRTNVTSCSGSHGLKSRPEYRLHRLRFIVVFSGKSAETTLCCHNHRLLRPSNVISH